MNKKGFTMIELLGVIVIMGILMGIGIPAVTRQLEKSKVESFNTMRLSICDAMRNKIMQENMVCIPPANPAENSSYNCRVDINDLLNDQYLDTLKDPSDEKRNCSGWVYVEKVNHIYGAVVDDYILKVKLKCLKYSTYNDDSTLKNSADCSNLTTRDFK